MQITQGVSLLLLFPCCLSSSFLLSTSEETLPCPALQVRTKETFARKASRDLSCSDDNYRSHNSDYNFSECFSLLRIYNNKCQCRHNRFPRNNLSFDDTCNTFNSDQYYTSNTNTYNYTSTTNIRKHNTATGINNNSNDSDDNKNNNPHN